MGACELPAQVCVGMLERACVCARRPGACMCTRVHASARRVTDRGGADGDDLEAELAPPHPVLQLRRGPLEPRRLRPRTRSRARTITTAAALPARAPADKRPRRAKAGAVRSMLRACARAGVVRAAKSTCACRSAVLFADKHRHYFVLYISKFEKKYLICS